MVPLCFVAPIAMWTSYNRGYGASRLRRLLSACSGDKRPRLPGWRRCIWLVWPIGGQRVWQESAVVQAQPGELSQVGAQQRLRCQAAVADGQAAQ